MIEIFHKFLPLIAKDPIFWCSALIGTALFIVQCAFTLLGGEVDEVPESGSFKWLSKQALTGFLMMFGWMGLTGRNEFNLSGLSLTALSLASGGIAILFTGLLFRGAKKLLSNGTVFNLEDAIGKQAVIYQRIPKGGSGKISLNLHNFTHEIDAISEHPEELPSFSSVQIIKKADEKTVVVVPIT